VSDSPGKRIEKSPAIISGTRATTKLKDALAPGKYVVKYRVVSEDGHVVNGSYFFSVK
jgi:methionine-rich copper-binding protein CopC